MEVSLNANIEDQRTSRIADALRAAFKSVAKDVSKNYGGTIQHLWIDFELVQSLHEGRLPFPFRFQKKLGGFDAPRFRTDFVASCQKHGYDIDHEEAG